MPWSPVDSNLGLFEVAFGSKDVAEYGGIFAVAPAFFAWMGAFAEAIGGLLLLIGSN
jgi:putative oxidoreductase